MEHLSLADDRSGTPHGARKGPGFSADAGGAASFDHLPLELRLKCLAYCDWQTLSRVACISRSTRALVSVPRPFGAAVRCSVRRPPAAPRCRRYSTLLPGCWPDNIRPKHFTAIMQHASGSRRH